MAAQTAKTINIIRGKHLAGEGQFVSNDDVSKLLEHIDALEELMDDADQMDLFGTQGWRYKAGIDE